MADAAGQKPTHTAFALKREGKRQQFRRWLEIGIAWRRENGAFQAFLDRTPIGGWTGFIHFEPVENGIPPLPAERPKQPTGDESGDEDGGFFGDDPNGSDPSPTRQR